MSADKTSPAVKGGADQKYTYVLRAEAKARPTYIVHNKFGRIAIGGEVKVNKPGRGLFIYRAVTSQEELKYFYEVEGLTHLIDKVES